MHVGLISIVLKLQIMVHTTTTQQLNLSEVNQAFNLTIIEHNFFKAGEGKFLLDARFAHISHKIIRRVRVRNNVKTGEQLGSLIKVCIFDWSKHSMHATCMWFKVSKKTRQDTINMS